MTTAQVVTAFIEGRSASNGRISTDGTNLYSYSTIIAFKEEGKTYVTTEGYSITTTRHVSELRKHLGYYAPLDDADTKERYTSVEVESGAFPYAGHGNRKRKIDRLDGQTIRATFAAVQA